MELVERYIAAVQRDLPVAKRQEIGSELKANIMDQLDALEEQLGSLSDANIAGVLKQIGHPRTVAQQFMPPQPLVSSGYMPLYTNTLFMVLGILFLLQMAESTTAWLASQQMPFPLYLKSLASGFLQEAVFGFTGITLTFWLMSRSGPEPHEKREQNWQPEQLPKAGPGWQHIALQDIFTDMATYVFLLIVIWYPLWMPAQLAEGNRLVLTETARQILQWTSPLALLGMISSLWQLRQRIWSRRMLIGNILLNSGFVAALITLAAGGPLLSLEPEAWQGVFRLERLERAADTGLVIIALFPLWEVLRDTRRAFQLHSQR